MKAIRLLFIPFFLLAIPGSVAGQVQVLSYDFESGNIPSVITFEEGQEHWRLLDGTAHTGRSSLASGPPTEAAAFSLQLDPRMPVTVRFRIGSLGCCNWVWVELDGQRLVKLYTPEKGWDLVRLELVQGQALTFRAEADYSYGSDDYADVLIDDMEVIQGLQPGAAGNFSWTHSALGAKLGKDRMLVKEAIGAALITSIEDGYGNTFDTRHTLVRQEWDGTELVTSAITPSLPVPHSGVNVSTFESLPGRLVVHTRYDLVLYDSKTLQAVARYDMPEQAGPLIAVGDLDEDGRIEVLLRIYDPMSGLLLFDVETSETDLWLTSLDLRILQLGDFFPRLGWEIHTLGDDRIARFVSLVDGVELYQAPERMDWLTALGDAAARVAYLTPEDGLRVRSLTTDLVYHQFQRPEGISTLTAAGPDLLLQNANGPISLFDAGDGSHRYLDHVPSLGGTVHIADLDGAAGPELFQYGSTGSLQINHLTDTTVDWQESVSLRDRPDAITTGDLDGDGELELLTVSRHGGIPLVRDPSDLSVLERFTAPTRLEGFWAHSLHYIEGSEVGGPKVAAVIRTDGASMIRVFDAASRTMESEFEAALPIEHSAVLNGGEELATIGGAGALARISMADGSILWQGTSLHASFIAAGEVDGDEAEELVVLTKQGWVVVIDTSTNLYEWIPELGEISSIALGNGLIYAGTPLGVTFLDAAERQVVNHIDLNFQPDQLWLAESNHRPFLLAASKRRGQVQVIDLYDEEVVGLSDLNGFYVAGDQAVLPTERGLAVFVRAQHALLRGEFGVTSPVMAPPIFASGFE